MKSLNWREWSCALMLLLFSVRVAGAEPVRLAIFSQENTRKEADLLTARLSEIPEIALVQRDDVDKLLAERQPGLAEITPGQTVALGKILGAQGVILLRKISSREETLISVSLVGVSSGAVATSVQWNATPAEPEVLAETVAGKVSANLSKLSVSSDDSVKLSVVNFRSLRGASISELAFTKLLTACLSSHPQFFVLERSNLETVAKEKAMGSMEGAFWTGSYLIRGTVEADIHDDSRLTIRIEIVSPGAQSGSVETVVGTRRQLVDLAKRSAEAIESHLKKAPAISESWSSDQEARQFLEDALVTFRHVSAEQAWPAAYAAWALGLRTPRLAEILVIIHLERLKSMKVSGNYRPPHHDDRFPWDYRMRSLIRLASQFENNPRYWRGMNDFWFPESLDEIDALLEYYKVFLATTLTDPAQRKINEDGMLAFNVLYVASLPHLLIHRELDAEKHRDRLKRMAADLRDFYQLLLKSNLSEKQREEILRIRTVMIPFWSAEPGEFEPALRKEFDAFHATASFGDRAVMLSGFFSAYYLAQLYARHSDMRLSFQKLAEDLRKSERPEDRALGEYIRYYSKAIPMEDLEERRRSIHTIYDNLGKLTEQAADDPAALGKPLTDLATIFDEEEWTERRLKIPVKPRTPGGDKEEALVRHLTRKVARQYQLFFVDHWPEGFEARNLNDSTGPFSYWASGEYRANWHGQEGDWDDVKAYYLPLLQRYHEEVAKASPQPEKLKFLSWSQSTVSRDWPEILPNPAPSPTQETSTAKPSITAKRSWSLTEHLPGGAKSLMGRAAFSFRARTADVFVKTKDRKCEILQISLPDLATEKLEIPVARFLAEEDEIRFYGCSQNEHFLYVYDGSPRMLKLDRRSGEWTSVSSLPAESGVELEGKFFFSNNNEFFSVDPDGDKVDVIANLMRSPSQSPLDSSRYQRLGIFLDGESELIVSAVGDEGAASQVKQYQYLPQSATWKELTESRRFGGVERKPFFVIGGKLMLRGGKPTEKIRALANFHLDLEGVAPSPREAMLGGRIAGDLLETDQGILLFVSHSASPETSAGCQIWFVSDEQMKTEARK